MTGNKGKADEIASITGWSVENINLDIPEIQSLDVTVVAQEKALTAYRIVGKPVVVDDTSMSIEALNSLPGALVSWFLDTISPQGILNLVEGEPNRRASVATCVGYADETGVKTFLGVIHGTLPETVRGKGGFGYDPIFVPDGSDRTYAEMTAEEKNTISMRRQALIKLRDYLLGLEGPNENMSTLTHERVERMFVELRETDPRKAAEIAYVLAKLHQNAGNAERANHYGRESIRLFDSCKMETFEDVAARFVVLAGVALPSIIHQGVVKDRLKPLQL